MLYILYCVYFLCVSVFVSKLNCFFLAFEFDLLSNGSTTRLQHQNMHTNKRVYNTVEKAFVVRIWKNVCESLWIMDPYKSVYNDVSLIVFKVLVSILLTKRFAFFPSVPTRYQVKRREKKEK